MRRSVWQQITARRDVVAAIAIGKICSRWISVAAWCILATPAPFAYNRNIS